MSNNFTRPTPVRLFLAGLFIMFCTASGLAQAPVINSFSPATGAVGVAVTLTGTNFNPTAGNNVVFFGATRANVTAASATSLTVTVPNGATYGAITVLNTGTGLAAYSGKFFLPVFSPNKGTITTADVAAKVDFPTGTAPYSVVIADIDGDGKPDLVIPNIGFSTVSVLLNNGSPGNPGFAAKMDFPIGSTPVSLAVGDLDGDGKPDLVTTNLSNNTVSVLLNTSSIGSISFAAEADFATGSLPYSVAIGDMDGDGKPDLVVANSNDNTVSVLLNNGGPGNISFAAQTTFATGVTPQSVAIGDIDGDGRPDLAVANIDANSVSVLLNNSSPGSLGFAGNVDLPTGSEPISVALGDIDGDGKLDLAVANLNSATVSVLLNTGSVGVVSFAGKVDKAVGTHPYAVAIGDINGDGKPDLAVANADGNTLSVFSNTSSTGSLSFGPKADLATASLPFFVAIGDIDGDGKPDLVVANDFSNKVSVLRNNPSSVPVITSFSPASGPVGTLVTITGANLNSPAAFTIGGQTAVVVSNDGGTLVGFVMPGAVTGGVSVTTGDGSVSGASNFTVTTMGAITAQQGNKLTGPTFGLLGASVALSADGNTAILGGGGFYFNCRCGFLTQGGAYMFVRSNGAWAQQGPMLLGTGGSSTANQGISVAISADGNTAVIGGSSDNSNAGAIWVFTRTAGTWSQQGAKLVGSGANNGSGGAQQGASVAISADGNTIMEGGPGNGNTGGTWVFTRSTGIWTQQGSIMNGTDSGSGDAQGSAVALSADGNTAAVGDVNDNGSIGATRIWTRTGSTWTQQGLKLTGPSVRFPKEGTAVALSADGNTVLVGGAFDNNSVGGTWVFTRSGGVWTEQGTEMTGTGFSGTPNQGWAVSLSADGNTAFVGGPVDNSNEGATWVFTRSGGVWTQQGSKLVGAGASALGSQGRGVAVSADGSTAMIGGPRDNSSTGSAWVYTPLSTVAPATQASNVVFINTTATATTASWTNGNGAARAVFMAAASSGSPASVNQVNYNANAAFATGDQIGSSGWYCIYNGTGSTVNITGLAVGTTYQVMAVEYNGTGSGVAWLTTAGTGNPAGVTTIPSSDATLASLSLSSGTLSPAFNSGHNGYTAFVSYSTSSIMVTATANDAGATVATTVNGTPASGLAPLNVGTNTIVTTVTAADGTTTNTYTVTLTRVKSENSYLSAVNPSVGHLSPTFAHTTTSYTLAVSNATGKMTVTPVSTDPNATIKVNGSAVTSGTASSPVALAAGAQTAINIVVTAPNRDTRTYTITVTRAPSADATLSNLLLSTGTLKPGFTPNNVTYRTRLTNLNTSITITPTTTDPNAVIMVNSSPVPSGSPVTINNLVVGDNTVSIVVTAQDGTTKKTYTLTVNRPLSINCFLASMNPGKQPLSPVFAPGTFDYTLEVSNATASMTLAPVTSESHAAMTINTAPAISGVTFGPIALNAGPNVITVVVTAQDGASTNTYIITVTRDAPAGANNVYQPISVEKPITTPALAEDGIVVHQGISPNGDGVNDFLQIDNISQYPDNKLTIMNRNGQLVYEAKGYDNSSKAFDGHGSKNGQMQLPGTYFYQLDYTLNGTTKHKTGFLVLKY